SSGVSFAARMRAPKEQVMQEHELWQLARRLSGLRLVDLTHAFRPGIPHWSGYPDEVRRDALVRAECGFWAVAHTVVGAWGTHLDAPAHMFEGGRTVDQIALREMILPLVVLDIHARVAADPDAVVTVSDVAAWAWITPHGYDRLGDGNGRPGLANR